MSEFSQRLAVVIGINQYENGIPSLRNAVNDAEQINWILKEQHGYKTWLLLDREATQDKLKELLTETLPKEVIPDECLLFYFAGHGKAENEDDGPQGYLIPQDARFGDTSSCLLMSQVHDWLTALPCRHFLAILDCCFAGAFRWSSTRDGATVPEEIFLEHYYRFIQDPAWQVITSASYDQTALDIFSLKDCRGKKGNHSPFAAALIDALKGEADTSPPAKDGKPKGDGVITATELYLYLRDCIEPATIVIEKRQTPGLWHLKKHDRGEYIFLTPGHELNLRNAPPLDESKNPYRGLESFDEEHKDLFFGRTALVNKLYEFVDAKPLTVVLGASGAGKSSLVRAGLIPELRKNHPDWTILDPIRPGESPFRELNNALTKANLPEVEVPDTALAQSIKNLNESIKVWASNNLDSKLLLFIDQSEELITLCKNDIERQEFLSQLAHAITPHPRQGNAITPHPPQLRVIITVRSDFEPQLRDLVVNLLPNTLQLKNIAIRESWQNGRITVPAMTRTELREAIEKPAEARVMYFDPHSLVDDLINEVADMPGALPLLSFALSELYLKYLKRQKEARDKGITIDRAITEADYKEIGGVTQSLTQRADREYEALEKINSAYKQIVRNVMLRMVAQGGGELTRRRVPKSELEYPETVQPQVDKVIQRFSEVRLLIPGEDGEDKPYVEPAHDALVRGWSKIRNWLEERQEKTDKISRFNKIKKLLKPRLDHVIFLSRLNRNNSIVKPQKYENQLKVNLFLQRQLTTAANNWLSKKEKEGDKKAIGFLWYDDPRLPQLEQIQQSDDNWFNQVEKVFVERSVRKKHQNTVLLWSFGLGFIVVLLGGLFFSLRGQRQAQIDQIRTLRQAAETNLRSNLGFDGLLSSLQSVKSLKQPLLQIVKPDDLLQNQVRATLQKAVYQVNELNRLERHDGSIPSVSFSPDGKFLASGGDDGKVILWDLHGHKLREFHNEHQDRAHQGIIRSISFSPNGKLLATVGDDEIVRLWKLQDKQLVELKGHKGRVWSVSFSPNGKLLATAGNDDFVRLWNLQTHQEMAKFRVHQIQVLRISFSPDGQQLATAGQDGTVRLWNLQGQKLAELKGHKGRVWGISFSPNGKFLATAGDDGTARLWNLQSRQQLAELKEHQGTVWSISFSPDGQRLATGDNQGTIRLWNLQGQQLAEFHGHQGAVWKISFNPKKPQLASAGADSTVRLWSLQDKHLAEFKGVQGAVRSVSFSPNGQRLAIGDEGGTIRLWNLQSRQQLAELKGRKRRVFSASFSPDSKLLAIGEEGTVRLWNLQDKQPVEFPAHQARVNRISFSSDGKLLATAGDDRRACLWNLQTRLQQGFCEFRHLNYMVNNVNFSPDGKLLATAGDDSKARLWNLQGKPLEEFKHPNWVKSASFSPDGKLLATGDQAGLVRLWSLQGQQLTEFKGHPVAIYSLSFSRDGQQLATVGHDGIARLWNLQGQLLAEFKAHLDEIYSVRFSPDGQQLATAGDDGTAKLWRIESLDQLKERGCNWVRDYLKNNPNVRNADSYPCNH